MVEVVFAPDCGGFKIVAKFYGVRTVIVEDASRFAREPMAQELGITRPWRDL